MTNFKNEILGYRALRCRTQDQNEKEPSKTSYSLVKLLMMASLLWVAGSLLLGAQTVYAVDMGQETVINGCMEDVAARNLNCTANDIQLAEVLPGNVTITDPCEFPGDSVTFTAIFDVVLTAQERHDIGIYFDINADPEGDGALTGTCSISSLHYKDDPPWLDLDGTGDDFVGTNVESGIQDTCGDIDSNHNPLNPAITITATCVDNDGDGFLDLPYCTSWRQPGANELCTGPLPENLGSGFSSGVVPGAPSKCKCDDTFDVPVPVPPAELLVDKTASPTSVNEPGAPVTFSVTVTNTGVDPNNDVTLNTLMDDIYGDITQVQGDIVSTTCSVPQTLAGNGGVYNCSFTANVVGNDGDSETDTVTASGVDENGNNLSGSDDATVTINGLLPAISVDKTASPTTVLEGAGELVTFTVVVENTSPGDPLTITSLVDDIYGPLAGDADCQVGTTLPIGGQCSFQFTEVVDGPAFTSETDTVTATGEDDEGNPASDSDSATVTILDDPAMIELIKTADPTSIFEEGDDVTYTFTINNLSTVDTVTINSLTDTIYGDLNGQGDCSVPQELAPLGSYSCSITVFVAGNAGDDVLNVATATGVDDDGQPVMDSDDATVDILDVPPEASLVKTAVSAVVTYQIEVTNLSSAEALTLDPLVDDRFGDITTVGGKVLATDCNNGEIIPALATYSCSFDGLVTTSPHTNEAIGTLSDDDGGNIQRSDTATVTFE